VPESYYDSAATSYDRTRGGEPHAAAAAAATCLPVAAHSVDAVTSIWLPHLLNETESAQVIKADPLSTGLAGTVECQLAARPDQHRPRAEPTYHLVAFTASHRNDLLPERHQ
jgi:hypothetical protein